MLMSPEPFDTLRTAPVEGRSTADFEFPEQVDPMLATPVDAARFGDEAGWAFEMKWDGVRTIAYLAGGRVKLLSRKGRDDTEAYFEVARRTDQDQSRDGDLGRRGRSHRLLWTTQLRPAAASNQPHQAG